MNPKQGTVRRIIGIAIVWLGTCICCALAIFYFYDLSGPGIIYPFKDHTEEVIAVFQTAFLSTLTGSWAIWFGTRIRRGPLAVLLRTGFPMLATLVLYAVAGWQSYKYPNFIFPSTCFGEYNWLTFIFAIAPTTATTASLLAVLSIKWTRNPESLHSQTDH